MTNQRRLKRSSMQQSFPRLFKLDSISIRWLILLAMVSTVAVLLWTHSSLETEEINLPMKSLKSSFNNHYNVHALMPWIETVDEWTQFLELICRHPSIQKVSGIHSNQFNFGEFNSISCSGGSFMAESVGVEMGSKWLDALMAQLLRSTADFVWVFVDFSHLRKKFSVDLLSFQMESLLSSGLMGPSVVVHDGTAQSLGDLELYQMSDAVLMEREVLLEAVINIRHPQLNLTHLDRAFWWAILWSLADHNDDHSSIDSGHRDHYAFNALVSENSRSFQDIVKSCLLIPFWQMRSDRNRVLILIPHDSNERLASMKSVALDFFQRSIDHVITIIVHNDTLAGCSHDSATFQFSMLANSPFWNLALFNIIQPQLVLTVGNVKIPTNLPDITVIKFDIDSWLQSSVFSSLSTAQLSSWYKPQISIQVITHKRPESLSRLTQSLLAANYLNDRDVSLTFHVDAQPDTETILCVNGFEWPFGPKQVRRRLTKGGLMNAVVESWYPPHENDDAYVIILEDDIEVSPLFYIWSKLSLLRYRYDSDMRSQRLFGISLYTPRIQEMTFPRRKIRLDQLYPDSTLIRWSLPCSWGAIYFPEFWREFHHYITLRFSKIETAEKENKTAAEVFIPGSRSNVWKSSWKKYFIEMMVTRGYFMIYPSFPSQQSFSTNHLEPGAHIGVHSRVRQMMDDFRVPLLNDINIMKQQLFHLPPLEEIRLLNLFGELVSDQELIDIGIKLRHEFVIRCTGRLVRHLDGGVECYETNINDDDDDSDDGE